VKEQRKGRKEKKSLASPIGKQSWKGSVKHCCNKKQDQRTSHVVQKMHAIGGQKRLGRAGLLRLGTKKKKKWNQRAAPIKNKGYWIIERGLRLLMKLRGRWWSQKTASRL